MKLQRLRELALEPVPAGAALDAFVKNHSFPLVDGNTVTFVFKGAADAVNLRHWIFGLASTLPFTRLPGSEFWYLVLEIPEESRVEYKLEVVRGARTEWLLDPLNPHRAHDPFGANSVCHTAGHAVPDWTQSDPESRTGTIESLLFDSRALGQQRLVRVYLPARFRRRARYPLLVVHDGDDYLNYSGLKTVLDNLIHRLEIPQLIVALSNPGNRMTEYADHEPHARHVVEELVPDLEKRFPLVARPDARGLMGASFGGVATLSTAWRNPGFFGQLLVQSGSFAFSDIGPNQRGPAFEPVVRFMNAFRKKPGKPANRIFVSCGTYETLIYENRSMVPFFQKTGMEVRYAETRDGHNWENWRDRLREGLSWLFPGPLWMVYE